MISWLKIKTRLKEGDMYVCSAGFYAGQMFIYIKTTSEGYGFLMVPSMKNEWIPKEKFEIGLKNGIIEYVERVPKFVRRTSKAKFEENSKAGV